eukprot:228358_1
MSAADIEKRIAEIEYEMSRTQKNKATNAHLGLLKARISKLKQQLIATATKSSGGGGAGFDVRSTGDARVGLVGFPSVGKSTLLTLLTGVESRAEQYEFTTLTCIPGIMEHNNTRIQLLDLPGIIEGASKGKGRGKQVIAVARSCDMVFMMVDAIRGNVQKRLLTKELFDCGIRLGLQPKDIYIKKTKGGGMKINATIPLNKGLNKRVMESILQSYKIHNCDIVIREDCSVDEFIDAIEGNRKYLPVLYGYNKIDILTIEELDQIMSEKENVVLSVKKKLFIDFTIEKLWDTLNMIRIYTKPKGSAPDLSEPVILKNGASVEDLCKSIHRDMIKKFRYCLVWGRSAKHRPQTVGISHVLFDEDVCQIVTKENTSL